MGLKFGKGKEIKSGGRVNTQKMEINVSKLADGGKIKLRLLGEVLPNQRFWTKKRDGGKFPLLSPYFNRETESFEPGEMLLGSCDKEFFYTVNCINRDTGELMILILKTTIYRYLYSLAQDPDYGDPADPDNGYDIVIVKERTGGAPQNVRYNCSPSLKSKPLTEEERSMELHDLEALYAPRSKEEYIDWIRENTEYLDVEAPEDDQANTSVDKEDIPF